MKCANTGDLFKDADGFYYVLCLVGKDLTGMLYSCICLNDPSDEFNRWNDPCITIEEAIDGLEKCENVKMRITFEENNND